MKRHYKVMGSRPIVKIGKKLTDSVDVQLSVTANVSRGKKFSREVIEEAIRYRAKHGKNPRGFTVRINRWRNPDRIEGDPDEVYKNPSDAEFQAGWRDYGPQKERFDTLGRALRGRYMVFTITEHRPARRKKQPKKTARRLGRKKS